MALLPLRQAADAVGVSRQTLYRYVKDGRISATVGHDGQKQVDTAELLRVFGRIDGASPTATAETAARDSLRQPETAAETTATVAATAEKARLEADLAAARTLLDATRAELGAAREREAKLLDIVQAQTRMLEYRAPDKPVAAPASSSSAAPWIALACIVVVGIVAAAWLAANRPAPPPPAQQAPVQQAPAPVEPPPTPNAAEPPP